MTFEEFKAKGTRGDAVFVSVSRNGRMGLSKALYEKLGSPGAVVLAFDRQKNLLQVRPAETCTTVGAATFSCAVSRKNGHTSGCTFMAREFVQWAGIQTDRLVRFRANVEDQVATAHVEPGAGWRVPVRLFGLAEAFRSEVLDAERNGPRSDHPGMARYRPLVDWLRNEGGVSDG